MINKVTLKELFKDTFRRSTLISIPNISDLLEVDKSMYTKWEIFYQIVRDALKTFEYYYPLTLIQRIYIEIDSITRKGYINGNFEAYLKGIVTEDQIVIVPAAIVGISSSHFTASTYPLRNYRYNPPEITDCWYSTNTYYVNSICKRPFPELYDEVTKEPTEQCSVYYLNKDVDTQYSIFRDEVYLSVCRYLMNLKKNMALQSMPIELFQGLEEDYNNLNSKQDNIYQQAATHSYWIM
jgi:hypothetical protein